MGLAAGLLASVFLLAGIVSWGYVIGGCVYALLDNLARPVYFQLVSRSHADYPSVMSWNAVSNQLGNVNGNAVLPLVTVWGGDAALGFAVLAMDGLAVWLGVGGVNS